MSAALVPQRLLGPDGNPLPPSRGPRAALLDAMAQQPARRRNIEARYDAASDSDEFSKYWAAADSLDSDAANSKGVRAKLVKRSRYEVANNGFADGIVQTLATDLVGIGPRIRIQTATKGFNQAVETVWNQWVKRVQLRRKLWCMAHAKVQDGESFAICRNNPKLRHPVKLDLVLIETEQCQSYQQPTMVYGFIDGLHFDEFGNVISYDILKTHPGGAFPMLGAAKPESIPAQYVLHWFLLRRPGQHRGVPEFRSTLQVGAASRRWREATVAAAETAADFAVLLHTDMPAGDAMAAAPFSAMEIQKRMMTALPMGWAGAQMKAEHPNATYEAFNKSQVNEFARPKSMPYNKAACDSSSYNYASGRLDHQTYYGSLDVEREDANDLVLDKLFELWWQEAVLAYGWNADPDNPPAHSWDWPKHPVADIGTEANANDTNLKNGSLSLSQLYSANGQDFEDELTQMASDYGITEDEMRSILMNAVFNSQNQQASMAMADVQQQTADASIAETATAEAETTTTAPAADAPATATDAATSGNVQTTALNGAQITAMVTIAQQQAEGSLPIEAARAMLRAAFPLMDKKLINVIADEIGKAPPVAKPQPFQQQPPAADTQPTEGDADAKA